MSAILEAPILEEEVETGEEISAISQISAQASSFPPRGFNGVFISPDAKSDLSAIPATRHGAFPLSNRHSAGAEPRAANVPNFAYSWPLAQPAISPSPGTALGEDFHALYRKYERRVYRQCYRMIRNQEDAEDLTQEVFFQLFRKVHTFRGDANFSTWLHRLTVNTVLMRLRRYRRWRETVCSYDAAPGSDQETSDVLTMVSALPAPAPKTLDKISLDLAIAQLPSGYKEIFLLHDLEGYRHDEIAKLLGISQGTSKSQLHKARLKLRQLVGSPGGRKTDFRSAPAVRGRRKRRARCLRAVANAYA